MELFNFLVMLSCHNICYFLVIMLIVVPSIDAFVLKVYILCTGSFSILKKFYYLSKKKKLHECNWTMLTE
jgi:hypothetical protein